jgi:hypothetical protein
VEPIDWRDEARLLRAAGWTPRRIAKMLGRSPAMVEEALRPPKPIKAAGDRKPRGSHFQPVAKPPEASGVKPLGAGRAGFAAAHVPRTIRVVLDERVLGSAAAAFVAGEIDRAELMRRISC